MGTVLVTRYDGFEATGIVVYFVGLIDFNLIEPFYLMSRAP